MVVKPNNNSRLILEFCRNNCALVVVLVLFVFALAGCDRIFHGNRAIAKVRVAEWLNGAASAVSFTFDDCDLTHQAIGDILEQHGFRGSFFVNPGDSRWNLTEYLNTYIGLAQRGHEVGNHSLNHHRLTELTVNQIEREVVEPIAIIQNDIGVRPISFVHPFNATNKAVDKVVFASHPFSRVSSLHSMRGRQFANINTSSTVQEIKNLVNRNHRRGRWLIIAGHGIDGSGYEPITRAFLTHTCQHLQSLGSAVWVGTLAQVAAYEYLKNEVKVKTIELTSKVYFYIEGFEPAKYKYVPSLPITLEITLRNRTLNTQLTNPDYTILPHPKPNTYLVTFDLKKNQRIHFYFAD